MFHVEGLGRSITRADQVQLINLFDESCLKKENVDFKDPEVIFTILDDARNNLTIFGRQVATAKQANVSFFAWYDLEKRPYLGPTSTDHELAFIMAN